MDKITLETAKRAIMPYGEHKGKTLEEVANIDPQCIERAYEHEQDDIMREKFLIVYRKIVMRKWMR